MKYVTAAIAVLLFGIYVGCSPFRESKNPKLSNGRRTLEIPSHLGGTNWLAPERVEAILKHQDEAQRSEEARAAHLHELLILERDADVLLSLRDQVSITVIRTNSKDPFKREFAVSELGEQAWLNEKPLNLVVVICPDMFPAKEGAPNEVDLMEIIDSTLQTKGVKRRVFEIVGSMHHYVLDSAAVF